MTAETKYSDGLVTITDHELVFHGYYFISGDAKKVPVSDIERIEVKSPTLRNGKWRLWGTGNIKTWFPQDWDRPQRDRIFIATLNSQWVNIGFTAKDGAAVEEILRQMGLIREPASLSG